MWNGAYLVTEAPTIAVYDWLFGGGRRSGGEEKDSRVLQLMSSPLPILHTPQFQPYHASGLYW
jgi:hypothetical protein